MNINSVNYTMSKSSPAFGNLLGCRNVRNTLKSLERDCFSSSYSSRLEPKIKYKQITMSDFEEQGVRISKDGMTASIKSHGFLQKKYTGIIYDIDGQNGLGVVRKYKNGKLITEKEVQENRTTIKRYDEKGKKIETYTELYDSASSDKSEPIYIQEYIDYKGETAIRRYVPENVSYQGKNSIRYFSYQKNGEIEHGPLRQEQLKLEFEV